MVGKCDSIHDYVHIIDNYENGCHCYDMAVEGLADGLSERMKYVNCFKFFKNINFVKLLFSLENSRLGPVKFRANKIGVDQY